MKSPSSGFTLIELLVVIMIIGILAAFGVPQYLASVENSKALDAASLVTMVGTTNRMYALDHAGTFAAGSQAACGGTTTCAGSGTACDLVGCKYLASQDFASKPYLVYAVNPAVGSCPAGGVGAWSPALPAAGTTTGIVACAGRQGGSGSYAAWGYAVDVNGAVYEAGGAPAPVQ